MNQDAVMQLGDAFPFEEIKTMLQVTSGDKKTGMAVFYLDSRTIQNRLDEAVGQFNWKNQFIVWHEIENNETKKIQKSQICGIAILNTERNEWVGKFDGAECSNIEPIKGGLSDSFKRAACAWGIGRYLYEIDGVWVDIEPSGKSYRIKNNQQTKLRTAYEAAVNKIFGTSTTPKPSAGSAENRAAASAAQNLPANNQQQAASPVPQPAAGNEHEKPATGKVVEFKVQSIKPAGEGSKLLELHGNDGKITSVYIKPGEDGISVGTQLRNVKIETKSNSYGKYNLLSHFEVAA